MDRVTINISGYHDIDQIYKGGKSIVFRALRDIDDTPVILKIKTRFKDVPTRDHPLFSESNVLRSISSEYVPKYYELKDETDELVLVCEDIGGKPLSALDPKNPPSLRGRLVVAQKIALALNDIHRAQFIHRDINPSNVVWDSESGRLQIIDFGLAMTLDNLNKQSPDSEFQGTITYIAPEQTGRVNRNIDYRADLYSLGATLYELFTHKPPFLADNDLELIKNGNGSECPRVRNRYI